MQLVRNPQTGEYGVFSPNTGLQPISREDAEVIQQSGMETFARSVGGAVVDNTLGAAEFILGAAPGMAEINRRRGINDLFAEGRAINDPQQQARRNQRGGLETSGQVAAFAGEFAIPGGTASRAGRAAQAIEGTQGRINRMVADNQARTASNVAQGRVQALADDAAAVKDPNINAVPEGVADDSINAQRNNSVRRAGKADVITADQADAMGMKLTPGERAYLRAWEADDAALVSAAERRMGSEDMVRMTRAAGVDASDIGIFNAKDKQEWFTRQVADEIGLYDVDRLTRNEIFAARDITQQTYKEVLDSGDFPVSLKFSAGADQIDVLQAARGIADDLEAVPPSVTQALDKIADAAKRGDGQTFHMDSFLEAQRTLSANAERAFASGKYDTGSTLTAIKQVLDDALEAALPEAERLKLKNANRKWRILKVLQRNARTISREDNGRVNVASFANAYRQMTPSYKRNTRELDDFEMIMSTVDTLSANRANAGSTLVRGITAAAPPVLTGAAVAGAGAAGAQLF